jgi:predicted TIM-barrel fold metal-dependent hydrolase
MLPPVLSIPDALEEIRFARQNGSVAVCLRPIEGERLLPEEYFYPIYEEAQRLDMAIAVHIANANPTNCELYRRSPVGRFAIFRMPTVAACLNLILSEVPQTFPKLRWGFIEAAAQWIPWVSREAARRFQVAGRKFPQSVFEEYKIYVTCQNNDDLPYILGYSGEHSLVIGTDYGHLDVSTEVDGITEFRARKEIGDKTKEKILHYNPKALYNI